MIKSLTKSVTYVAVFFVSLIYVVSLSSISFDVSAESEKLSLAQRVKHLEELNQTRNQVQADISYQVSELQREVRSLTGQVEENSFKLQQIQDRQRELYRDIESRLGNQPSSRVAAGEKPNTDNTTGTMTKAPASVSTTNHGNAGKDFEAAFALVRNKEYAAAISAFGNFLTKYPNSSYSDNARYWMGQVFLVQGNLADAETQFTALITEFPESKKLLAAKLKLGDIFSKQEKWSQAKVQYNEVVAKGTGSQKQLATKALDKIKKAGH